MYDNSILQRTIKLLPRDLVFNSIAEHSSDDNSRSFKSWDHLICMLVAQYSGAESLRDLETIFNSQTSHHYHLNTDKVRRSTLSESNATRDYGVFCTIAKKLISLASGLGKEAKDALTIIDSSPIQLSGRGHEWSESTSVRKNNRGLKLHLSYLPESGEIEYVDVTAANVNDITAAKGMPLIANRVYVYDKGYCDYNWWQEIADTGSTFVTRLKQNSAFKVIRRKTISTKDKDFILSDNIICLTNKKPRGGKVNNLAGKYLRLLRISHPKGGNKPFFIVTNDLDAPASKVTNWYKERWKIENLFKWIKQNLKIKNFLGENENAIKIQIFVAIIAYILAWMAYKMDGCKARFKDFMVTLRTHLFVRPQNPQNKRRRLLQQRLELQKKQQLQLEI